VWLRGSVGGGERQWLELGRPVEATIEAIVELGEMD
jgi:hypothetical protein